MLSMLTAAEQLQSEDFLSANSFMYVSNQYFNNLHITITFFIKYVLVF